MQSSARAPKTERVPIMFDKILLQEVDDFSFSNRIRTRAKAVRELVRIGLAAKAADEANGTVERAQ